MGFLVKSLCLGVFSAPDARPAGALAYQNRTHSQGVFRLLSLSLSPVQPHADPPKTQSTPENPAAKVMRINKGKSKHDNHNHYGIMNCASRWTSG